MTIRLRSVLNAQQDATCANPSYSVSTAYLGIFWASTFYAHLTALPPFSEIILPLHVEVVLMTAKIVIQVEYA